MNEKDILEKIIQEGGNCCWAKPSICKNCPMSRLKTREDGTYVSCVESLGVTELSEEEADAVYLKAAERALLGLELDDMLTKDGEV